MPKKDSIAADSAPSEEPQGAPLVTVLYSEHRDLYKLPALGVDLWLSVQVYPMADFGRSGGGNVGAAKTVNGLGWRRSYRNWSIIAPGAVVTLPADDPVVADYANQVSLG